MKKLIIWLAGIFNVDLTVEKIVYRDKIVEVEKQIVLEGEVEGDVTVNGDLFVTGNIYVAGNISSHGGIYYGMSTEEVKMMADKEISALN